jgi:L-rhamnonate dehydratase
VQRLLRLSLNCGRRIGSEESIEERVGGSVDGAAASESFTGGGCVRYVRRLWGSIVKIVDVEAVYPKYKMARSSWRDHFWQIIVRIEADSGFVGYGYGGGGVASVEIVNRHFRGLLIGRELNGVEDISTLWDDLYRASTPYGRKGLAVMALSGVDIALWDLLGRAEQLPVHRLINRKSRERVRAYATGQDTDRYADMGFNAQKLPLAWLDGKPDPGRARSAVERARKVLGPDALLMVDAYMSWDFDTSLEMARLLADLNVYFFEDVISPDHLDELAELRTAVKPLLIAGGEHEFTEFGFKELARTRCLDIWQPDITWCGGITAGLRILAVAESNSVPVMPHRGGEVWGLHLVVATNCQDIAEYVVVPDPSEESQLWLNQPRPVDGILAVGDEPGFGVVLNEALL